MPEPNRNVTRHYTVSSKSMPFDYVSGCGGFPALLLSPSECD